MDIETVLCIAGIVVIYGWMQHLSHKQISADDGGRAKFIRPAVPKDMLYKTPPYGSIVFGRYKGKYVCKPVDMEGAILVNGGSGSGKSASQIKPYLLNCNKLLRKFDEKTKDKKRNKHK